jgi:ubiquinone/menaquinone biosynthesis C-methylase UbiE
MEKIDTEKQVKEFYKEKGTVEQYEKSRYGNIKKSLSHWIDCDAIEYFLRKYAPARNGIFLDLACGTGRLTRGLASKGFRIISSDFSGVMLEAAKQKCPSQGMPFLSARADALHLPFKDFEFDGVFTIRFIRHYKIEQRKSFYRQIHRVLKEKGILVFDVLNSAVDVSAGKRLVYDETYDCEGIRQELSDNGFELLERVAGNIVGIPIYTIAKKWSLVGLGRFLASRYRRREEVIDKAAYWVVAAQKVL